MFGTKKVICLLLAAAAVFSVSACARLPQLAKPAIQEGAEAVKVTGSCEVELVDGGQTLRVNGTCSLMDGTNGLVSVLNANGSVLDKRKFTKQGDEISYDFAVGEDWPATVYGFISFDTQQCDAQPAEVTDAYGKRFQNLEGDDVIWDTKGVIAVFQSEALDIPGGKM